MGRYGVKLPDVGEGVAEAELIAWHVAVGDTVTNSSVLAEVMTDKATVEISSPVAGTVLELLGSPGDTLAVGAEFVALDTESSPAGPSTSEDPSSHNTPTPASSGSRDGTESANVTSQGATESPRSTPSPANSSSREGTTRNNLSSAEGRHGRAVAAPAVRARAKELGIDLATVVGSGPDGRVLHEDLDRVLLSGRATRPVGPPLLAAPDEPEMMQVIGLRRRIADRLSQAWREIPHITYVEEVDVTDLEARRADLNRAAPADAPRLTLLPFLTRAIVIAVAEQPTLNAHFDAVNERLSRSPAVHVGIATQTDDGLMVPVVRHAEARGLHDLAAEIGRVSTAARTRTAAASELSGSTITITSLGAIGGIATTPIINQPEVAIVGVNKIATRPVWRGDRFEPRQVMHLSCSFDHRIVDGWDAATFVQRIKALLESPAGL